MNMLEEIRGRLGLAYLISMYECSTSPADIEHWQRLIDERQSQDAALLAVVEALAAYYKARMAWAVLPWATGKLAYDPSAAKEWDNLRKKFDAMTKEQNDNAWAVAKKG